MPIPSLPTTHLRDAGASLQVAGLTALLWIPWGIRFLWVPLVERWRLLAGRLVAATTDVASDGFTVEPLASQQRG